MATINTSKAASVDIVYSADDGGWYAQETQRTPPYNFRTSRKIYSSHADAQSAYLYGDIKWTKWN